jgi:flagellar hook assembly protein FlgD
MSTLTTFSVEPKQDFDKILLYPNPFKLAKHSFVTIDGLVKNSTIKILSISGKLIKTIISPGGRLAFWDGKDENGKFVSSGIYILVAFDEEADKITTSKFAVIR